MKKIFFILSLLITVACSPVAYDLAVDVKKHSEFGLDLKGCPPSVVGIFSREGSDSAYTVQMALGTAEKLEKDLSLAHGAVPVFSFFKDSLDVTGREGMSQILTTAGSDRVIVLDSLVTGDYSIETPEEKAYNGREFMYQTLVKLPFTIRFTLLNQDSLYRGKTPVEASSIIADKMEWTLLSDARVDQNRVMAKILPATLENFREMGNELAAKFSPQWEEQRRMLISYDNSTWNDAYQLAMEFMWRNAMPIWMKLAESSNPKKAAFAAYNLSVALEIQEQYDLALEWLQVAEEKYPFSEISVERKHIEKAIKERK